MTAAQKTCLVVATLLAALAAAIIPRQERFSVGPTLPEGKVAPRISASGLYIVAPDGSLWTWEIGRYKVKAGIRRGSLEPKPKPAESPQRVGTNSDWMQVESGSHSIGLKTDGSLWGWGANSQGQAGQIEASLRVVVPTKIGTDTNWIRISAGSGHSLALKQDGSLWAWGRNVEGQVGDGSDSNRFAPVQIGSDRDWKEVSAGLNSSFALRRNGTLWGWGLEGEALGSDAVGTIMGFRDVLHPRPIGNDTNWVSISAGPGLFLLALRADGTVWIFGADVEWCSPLVKDWTKPGARVGSDSDWCEVRAGDHCLFARKHDGSWWVCGRNSSGELGLGVLSPPQASSSREEFTPLQRFPFAPDPWAFGSGSGHTVLLARDGNLWSWGVRVGALEKSSFEQKYHSVMERLRSMAPGRHAPSVWSPIQTDASPHRLWRLPEDVRRSLGKDRPAASTKP